MINIDILNEFIQCVMFSYIICAIELTNNWVALGFHYIRYLRDHTYAGLIILIF